MIAGIIFVIAAILFMFLWGFWLVDKMGDKEDSTMLGMFIMASLLAIGLLFIFGTSEARAVRQTYEKALDNNPYKKEYIYKQVDSTYVIIDSVYVKKEEK